MKSILVRLVVLFTFIFTMDVKSATILWFTGPGYVSGGNEYNFENPTGGLTFFAQYSGDIANNLSLNFNGTGGASLSLRTATTGNPWEVGHTYRSTDNLGGHAILTLNAPVSRTSSTSVSAWEFTILEATYVGVYSKFAADVVITDLNGEKTGISARYKSNIDITPIPEPGTLCCLSFLSFFLFRRKR